MNKRRQEHEALRDYATDEPAASHVPYHTLHRPVINHGHDASLVIGRFNRIDQELAYYYHPGRAHKR
jgi:hypothetical protein